MSPGRQSRNPEQKEQFRRDALVEHYAGLAMSKLVDFRQLTPDDWEESQLRTARAVVATIAFDVAEAMVEERDRRRAVRAALEEEQRRLAAAPTAGAPISADPPVHQEF